MRKGKHHTYFTKSKLVLFVKKIIKNWPSVTTSDGPYVGHVLKSVHAFVGK